MQRFLDPNILASISGLDLVAKTVVDGFVAGLHRSPDFGFSQEFAEYRAYSPGDDLRHIDWNVFARTDRCYLKRYKGETNSQMILLLDASKSMAFSSQPVNKMDYARYLAASLCYLAQRQRDAAGLIVFDDEVRQYVAPSTRQGQLARLLHGVNAAEPRSRTEFSKPFIHFQQFLRRRGIVVVISDFWEDPDVVTKTVEPLRFRGNEVVLFHVLDPQEIQPELREPAVLVDMETDDSMEVSPEYAAHQYRDNINKHLNEMREKAEGAGIGYHLLSTAQPLDASLRQYLVVRQGRM